MKRKRGHRYMSVDYFPAGLTGRFTDREGTEELRFLCDETAEFSYSIPFRGRLLQYDHLYELMPLLPLPGELMIPVPALFCQSDGEGVPLEILVKICMEPDETGKYRDTALDVGLTFQCNLQLQGQQCQTPAYSDRNVSAVESGLEGALLKLGNMIRPAGQLQICFFCRHSDYEPNTSIGHLYCFEADREEYAHYAFSSSSWNRKYAIWNLNHTPVDEFHRCDAFEPRPEHWGYRG
jgi:hypothetical protein